MGWDAKICSNPNDCQQDCCHGHSCKHPVNTDCSANDKVQVSNFDSLLCKDSDECADVCCQTEAEKTTSAEKCNARSSDGNIIEFIYLWSEANGQSDFWTSQWSYNLKRLAGLVETESNSANSWKLPGANIPTDKEGCLINFCKTDGRTVDGGDLIHNCFYNVATSDLLARHCGLFFVKIPYPNMNIEPPPSTGSDGILECLINLGSPLTQKFFPLTLGAINSIIDGQLFLDFCNKYFTADGGTYTSSKDLFKVRECLWYYAKGIAASRPIPLPEPPTPLGALDSDVDLSSIDISAIPAEVLADLPPVVLVALSNRKQEERVNTLELTSQQREELRKACHNYIDTNPSLNVGFKTIEDKSKKGIVMSRLGSCLREISDHVTSPLPDEGFTEVAWRDLLPPAEGLGNYCMRVRPSRLSVTDINIPEAERAGTSIKDCEYEMFRDRVLNCNRISFWDVCKKVLQPMARESGGIDEDYSFKTELECYYALDKLAEETLEIQPLYLWFQNDMNEWCIGDQKEECENHRSVNWKMEDTIKTRLTLCAEKEKDRLGWGWRALMAMYSFWTTVASVLGPIYDSINWIAKQSLEEAEKRREERQNMYMGTAITVLIGFIATSFLCMYCGCCEFQDRNKEHYDNLAALELPRRRKDPRKRKKDKKRDRNEREQERSYEEEEEEEYRNNNRKEDDGNLDDNNSPFAGFGFGNFGFGNLGIPPMDPPENPFKKKGNKVGKGGGG